ncbi:MAG: tRNA (guanosine(37)-N1)-methyltransferase TrmD [Patescibacteria group bacterium]|jgi:tRNA (guanine37-N1)-methyltransferase
MKFQLLSIFPNIFDSYLNESILKRARDKKAAEFKVHNLRDWTSDKHKTVDDAPYGGGAGMLMKIEPLYKALEDIKKSNKKVNPKKRKILLMSAGGQKWTQALAQKYSKLDEVILVCGRYEGVDARLKKFIDEEISIGDYVLTGGELPALTIIDSIVRLLPGVLGNSQSVIEESHSESGVLEYPQYTRPEIFMAKGKKYPVPKVLLSGDHKKIEEWRKKSMKKA